MLMEPGGFVLDFFVVTCIVDNCTFDAPGDQRCSDSIRFRNAAMHHVYTISPLLHAQIIMTKMGLVCSAI